MEKIFTDLNQAVELENRQRLKDGTLIIPKSEIIIYGQMSLMLNESVARFLNLIQTAGMDAQLRMDYFTKNKKKIPLNPNEHINLKEAVWAGRVVEPRILEVLPAAYERFKKHFDGGGDIIEKLKQIIDCVKQEGDHKIDFYGISIEKLKPWFFVRLRDGRSKPMDQRKVSKTYRFKPETVRILKALKDQTGRSETEVLEDLVAQTK